MDDTRRGDEEQKVDAFQRLREFKNIGLRFLTLGILAKDFLGDFGLKHIFLHVLVHLSTTVFAIYELAASLLLSESFIELLSHWYVTMYCWSFAFQFTYLCGVLKEFREDSLEHFHSTKMVPELAERTLNRNMDDFKRFFVVYGVIIGGTGTIYISGTMIEAILELATTGTVEQIFILSYYSNVPLWGQVIVTIVNIVTTTVCITVTIAVFITTGIRALEIKTQCEILKEALTLANVDIRGCVQDHVELIRIAGRSVQMFKILNNPMFFTIYLLLAVQLLNLTLIEPTGSYFFSLVADSLSSMLILHSQCWFSATVTLAMESIATSSYNSPWCDRNKHFAKDVLIMMMMAQRPIKQKLWLDTLIVERATTLGIIQSSYSFYTVLMIFQGRK